jgi:hypothetical protein
MKSLDNLLWISVMHDTIYLRKGGKMPREHPDRSNFSLLMFGGDHGVPRKEFERWSGVTLPKGNGIYGLEVKLAAIRRVRATVEVKYVAAEKETVTFTAEPMA